jgi:hypothetical protein
MNTNIKLFAKTKRLNLRFLRKSNFFIFTTLFLITVVIILIIFIINISPNNKLTATILNKITGNNNDSFSNPKLIGDLDGDGINEWLVINGPIGSGGYTGFDLFTITFGQRFKVFSSEPFYQGKIKIEGNKIKVEFGYPREGDSNCCPSRIKERFYIYKNGKVKLESEKIRNN